MQIELFRLPDRGPCPAVAIRRAHRVEHFHARDTVGKRCGARVVGDRSSEHEVAERGRETRIRTEVEAVRDHPVVRALRTGGNNVPVNGGGYNADGLTVAEVLSTTGAAPEEGQV